jgi:P-type Ca2+ transporter type 2C
MSIALGFASLPLAALICLIPGGPCELFFKKLGFLGRRKGSLPTTNPEADGWAGAITMACDNLSTFSDLCGGRIRSSSFDIKSRFVELNPKLGPYLCELLLRPLHIGF